MILELIVGYFSVVFAMFIHVLCFKRCVERKLDIKWFKILATLLVSVLIMLNNVFNIDFFKSIICFILIFILCKIWFNEANVKTFYYSVVISIISMFLEFLLINALFARTFNCLEAVNQSLTAKTTGTIIHNILVYLVINFEVVVRIIRKFENIIEKYLKYDILLLLILIISNLFLVQYGKNYESYSIYIASILSIVILSLLLYFLLKSNFAKENLKLKNQYLLDSIKKYEIIADDYSELRHNLNADFLAIRSLANTETQQIIDETIKKYDKNYDWIAKIGTIPKGLQGVLCIKIHEFKKENIYVELNTNIKEDIVNQISMKKYANLCEILEITLNNAKEAAKNSAEKSIFISILQEKKVIKIKIMNTFKNVIDIERLGKLHYTTKGNSHGIGLNYISRIDKKGLKIKTEIINNIFIISVEFSLNH